MHVIVSSCKQCQINDSELFVNFYWVLGPARPLTTFDNGPSDGLHSCPKCLDRQESSGRTKVLEQIKGVAVYKLFECHFLISKYMPVNFRAPASLRNCPFGLLTDGVHHRQIIALHVSSL